MGLTVIQWASAILHNGLGQYEEALTRPDRPARIPTILPARSRN